MPPPTSLEEPPANLPAPQTTSVLLLPITDAPQQPTLSFATSVSPRTVVLLLPLSTILPARSWGSQVAAENSPFPRIDPLPALSWATCGGLLRRCYPLPT